MNPDELPKHPGQRDPGAFLRGVVYGFRVGREYGFGEGVAAMHRVLARILPRRNGGVRPPDDPSSER